MTKLQIAALRVIADCPHKPGQPNERTEALANLARAIAAEAEPKIVTDPTKLLLVDTATELGNQLRQVKAAAENLLWLHAESVFINGDDDLNRVESALKGLRQAIDGKCTNPQYVEAPITTDVPKTQNKCKRCGQERSKDIAITEGNPLWPGLCYECSY